MNMKMRLIISLVIAPFLTVGVSYSMNNQPVQLKLIISTISIANRTDLDKKALANKPNKNIAISKDLKKKAEGSLTGGIEFFINDKSIFFFQGSPNYAS